MDINKMWKKKREKIVSCNKKCHTNSCKKVFYPLDWRAGFQ